MNRLASAPFRFCPPRSLQSSGHLQIRYTTVPIPAAAPTYGIRISRCLSIDNARQILLRHPCVAIYTGKALNRLDCTSAPSHPSLMVVEDSPDGLDSINSPNVRLHLYRKHTTWACLTVWSQPIFCIWRARIVKLFDRRYCLAALAWGWERFNKRVIDDEFTACSHGVCHIHRAGTRMDQYRSACRTRQGI